jgi:hypothetical protein
MHRIFFLAALILASQLAHANSLTKDDPAVTWLQAPTQEQAAIVLALGEAAGVTKKSELRHVIFCMRESATGSAGKNTRIEDLFKACLPKTGAASGDAFAVQSSAVVDTAALEEAELLHERVMKKDAEAMYALAMLIGSKAPKGQAEYEVSNWPKYGGRYVFGRNALLLEAASLENRNAKAYLCKVASDPGAPARYRANKDKWCAVEGP